MLITISILYETRCLSLFLSVYSSSVSLQLCHQCSVRSGCVMPPLMACEVSPFPNGLFCHPAQHWVTCRQRPSPPSCRFPPCTDQVAISWTGAVTAALTCISAGLQHCHFDHASTGSGRCQDRGPTDWPLSLQPDMARGQCWLQSLGITVLPSLFIAKTVSELIEMLLTAFY